MVEIWQIKALPFTINRLLLGKIHIKHGDTN